MYKTLFETEDEYLDFGLKEVFGVDQFGVRHPGRGVREHQVDDQAVDQEPFGTGVRSFDPPVHDGAERTAPTMRDVALLPTLPVVEVSDCILRERLG